VEQYFTGTGFRAYNYDISTLLCVVITGVVGTLAKLAKTITLRITTDKLYFILSERLINGGVGIWCEMLQVSYHLSTVFVFCDALVIVT